MPRGAVEKHNVRQARQPTKDFDSVQRRIESFGERQTARGDVSWPVFGRKRETHGDLTRREKIRPSRSAEDIARPFWPGSRWHESCATGCTWGNRPKMGRLYLIRPKMGRLYLIRPKMGRLYMHWL